MNPGGNKGFEGGKSSVYLLVINQIKMNKVRVLLQYFKNSSITPFPHLDAKA